MALFRWRGDGAGTKSAWADGRNWVDASEVAYAVGVYPGSVAAQYDDVIFDEELGATALSVAAYDAVGAGDEELNTFKVSPFYDGTIASGGWLKFNADRSTSEIIIEATSAGVINIQNEGVDAASQRVKTIRVIDSDGTVTIKGVFTNAEFMKGVCVLDAATDITTTLVTGYISNDVGDLTLTIPNVTGVPTIISCGGGTISCSEPVTTLNISAGKWTQETGDITTVTMTGGSFYWTDGDVTTAVVRQGLFTGADSSAPRTLGTAEVYAGGIININNGMRNIVLTNYITAYEGSIIFSPGEQVQI